MLHCWVQGWNFFFWKSVNICQSHGQLSRGSFFYETRCIYSCSCGIGQRHEMKCSPLSGCIDGRRLSTLWKNKRSLAAEETKNPSWVPAATCPPRTDNFFCGWGFLNSCSQSILTTYKSPTIARFMVYDIDITNANKCNVIFLYNLRKESVKSTFWELGCATCNVNDTLKWQK